MAHWIFKCNTDWFDLDGRLADPDKVGSWKVNTKRKNQIHRGDMAFIWQIQKEGRPAGIRAVCSIDSEPKLMRDLPVDLQYSKLKDGDVEKDGEFLQVLITYTDSAVPVTGDEIKKAVPSLSVFSPPWNETNYPIKYEPNEAAQIVRLIAESKKRPLAT
jgi:hypothetical protein